MENDFDLTAFLARKNNNGEDAPTIPADENTDDQNGNSSFDLTAFLANKKVEQAAKPDEDYGVMDRQRDTIVAETGDKELADSKALSLAANVLPFAGDEIKKQRDMRLQGLEFLRSGAARKELDALRKSGAKATEKVEENKSGTHKALDQASVGFDGTTAVLSQYFREKKQLNDEKERREKLEKQTADETYYDHLTDLAVKKAGLNETAVAKLREKSKTPEEFADKLKGLSEGELKAFVNRKKEAAARLEANPAGTTGAIVNGLFTNLGYQGKYIVASAMPGGIGYALLAADTAEQRAKELGTKTYDVDADGNLIVLHTDDDEKSAMLKGAAGGIAEVAVEQFLEKTIGWAAKGMPIKMFGVDKVVAPVVAKGTAKVGSVLNKTVGKAGRGMAAALSKKPVGKFIVGMAQNFGKYQKYTGINGMPMEMIEEHVQDFCDDVLGFGTQDRVYTSAGLEAKKWWNEKLTSGSHNADLFLGLIGTMGMQGIYAGAKAHHEIAKWRQNPAGFLKTMIDPKKVDALSDDEVHHLYNLVASPNFTKDRVERFLGHVQKRTELAAAVAELKDANESFWVDEAAKKGVKSQFDAPTRPSKIAGGVQIDYRPFKLKDGRTVMRAYDKNTGISIDKYDDTHFIVTNADGLRLPVVGADAAEAGQKALAMADKCSISNQLKDLARPNKIKYIASRVAKFGGRDKFRICRNIQEFNKNFPEMMNDRDYDPSNPAIKLADGRIILIADNIKDAYEVNRLIAHESAIHNGLAKRFTTEEKAKFLKNINDPAITKYRERIDAMRKKRGLAPIDWNQPRYIEEQFAHVWDRRRANPLLSQKVAHWLRDMGRSVGLPVQYNTADLEVIVQQLQEDAAKKAEGADFSPEGMTEDYSADHADSVPYNEGTLSFEGETADPNAPHPHTESEIAVRQMERADRIKAKHPHLWEYALRETEGDEGAALDLLGDHLKNEAKSGKSGEAEKIAHAANIVSKIENHEDLSPDDIEFLKERQGNAQGNARERRIEADSIPISYLYTHLGYRKQKNGSWKYTGEKGKPMPKPALAAKKDKPGVQAPVTAVPQTVKKSKRQVKQETEKKFVEQLLTKGGAIQRLPARSLKTGDGELAQFKGDVDPTTGTNYEIPGEYDEMMAGLPVVMHFEDGHYETVTGRHRISLAQKQGLDVNVIVIEHGEEGKPNTYSKEDAYDIDAKSNIKDGKGTIKDYIRYFKRKNMTREEAEKEGMIGMGANGNAAFALYADATSELYDSVDFDNVADNDSKTITPEQAAIIAYNAPKDADPINASVQRSMRDYCVANPKARGDRLGRVVQRKIQQLKERKENGGGKLTTSDNQRWLFAEMEQEAAATEELDKEENFKEKKQREWKKVANDLRDIKNGVGRKKIDPAFAKELGLIGADGKITDDKKTLEAAAKKALEKAFLWSRIELPEDLQKEMDAELNADKSENSPAKPSEAKPVTSSTPEAPKGVEGGKSGKSGEESGKPTAAKPKPAQNEVATPEEDAALFAKMSTKELKEHREIVASLTPAKTGWTKEVIARKLKQMDEELAKRQGRKPAKPASKTDADDEMAKAKEIADDHIVTYGNGNKATLAAMIKSGGATFYEDGGLLKMDKGPHVVTIGFETFVPLKGEIPYLRKLQKERDEREGKSDKEIAAPAIAALNDGYEIRLVKEGKTPQTILAKPFKGETRYIHGTTALTDDELSNRLVAMYHNGWEIEIGDKVGETKPAAPETKSTETETNEAISEIEGVDLGDVGDEFDALGIEMWFGRGLEEEHSEDEKQAHNLMIGVKMVKLFASKGFKDFSQFAKTFAARIPDAYRAARDYILGMWLTARMMGTNVDPVTEDVAREVLAVIDKALGPKPSAKADVSKTETTNNAIPNSPAETRTQKEIAKGEKISKSADAVVALIEKGVKFSREELMHVVEDVWGGKVSEGALEMKDVTDIMELAVNRFMLKKDSLFSPAANADVAAAGRVIQRIRDEILGVIPTQTTRSAEAEKMQQFSTPPHEAFMAAWVANINDKDTMIEPSAGIGGIAVFGKIAGADVILNELSPRRAAILGELGIAPKVWNFNAEELYAMFYPHIKSGAIKRPTVIVMNPPFSNSQRTNTKDTFGIGGKHVEEALDMLAPGGRLVAIVGNGMAHDTDSPKARAWWRKIGEKYHVRADIRINGSEYTKYGTSYDNNIIVIDKVAPNSQKAPVYGIIRTLDELPALLEGVKNDRPTAKSDSQTQPAADERGGNGGNGGAQTSPGTPVVAGPRVAQGNGGGNGGGRTGSNGLGRPGVQTNSGRGNAPDGGVRSKPGVSQGSVRGGSDNEHNVSDSSVLNEPADAESVSVTSPNGANGDVRTVGNGTFAEYKPSKVHVPGSKPHPTPLVESTAMASVLPPDPTYTPIIPKSAIECGMPSEAQLEQIIYAGQAHNELLPDGRRRGYFFGDGTGLGKGTEIGGVISDNYNHGRKKAIWVSKNSSLFDDAKLDLVTYGLDKEVFEVTSKNGGKLASKGHGIAFLSYSGLARDVVFDTNGRVTGSKKGKVPNFNHIVEWFGKDYDGVIVFDESHLAGNAIPMRGTRGVKKASERAKAVVALQDALPNARILYVSATGATEVSNLSYATRLGLWGEGTAFRSREEFIEKVSSGGLSVMEIVARDMKSMGCYLARSLSYDGIVNRKIEHKLSGDQQRKYDEMCDAWQLVVENIREALISTGAAGNSKAVSAVMSAFWGGEQRFFNQVLTAMQMPSVLSDAKKMLADGNSVVFQLVNTNEATQEKAVNEMKSRGEEINADELDLSPRDILVSLVQNAFPTTKYVKVTDQDGNDSYVVLTDANDKPVEDPKAVEARDALLEHLRMMKLDENPLEVLLREFGAENVAEITGRGRRREEVTDEDGNTEMKLVARSKAKRDAEIEEFNAGKRRVLVFSDAGGTGKSFHADRRFGNQQKRIHYLIQAGWRADAALQGLGRTHRSNEVQPPEYVLCSTDIKGHQRFISTVARRLAQLGSLTAGDRSSAGSGVFSEEDNLENQYARGALLMMFRMMHNTEFGRFNIVCKQLGFMKYRVNNKTGEIQEVNTLIDEKSHDIDVNKIPKVPQFLNRILMCRVETQNKLFDEFMDYMSSAIEMAKSNGTFDPGLERLQGENIKEKNRTELWNNGKGTGSTDIVEVSVSKKNKRLTYEKALEHIEREAEGRERFFVMNEAGKMMAIAETNKQRTDQNGMISTMYRVRWPDGKSDLVSERRINNGLAEGRLSKINDDRVEELWNIELDTIPEYTDQSRFFVHGTLLPIWDKLAPKNPRIYRIVPTDGGKSFLGMEIQADSVNSVLGRFGKKAKSIELTPEIVRTRVIKEGKRIPLLYGGETYSLKRAKVMGENRIEVDGPESVAAMKPFIDAGVAFMEKINYVPRLFVPDDVNKIAQFLKEFPAVPEDGGINGVDDTGSKYAGMSYDKLRTELAAEFDNYRTSDDTVTPMENIKAIVQAMSTPEIEKQGRDFKQYDDGESDNPFTQLRNVLYDELKSRGVYLPTSRSLWFSRDLEEDDAYSAVSIFEMNEWRKARGLPEFGRARRTHMEDIVKKAKYVASNPGEMERFVKVTNQTPFNWTATDVTATHEYILNLELALEEKDQAYSEALLLGNTDQADAILKSREMLEKQIDAAHHAMRVTAREWGLAGLARRMLLNRNGNFVRFLQQLRADAGRQLTEEEERHARTLWDAYKAAQGKLDEESVRKTSELLRDILKRHMAAEVERHFKASDKEMKQIEDEYQFALDHLMVHANRAGGFLIGLPQGRKWIDALRRFHMAAGLAAGHKLTVDEMLKAIRTDLEACGIDHADDHDILQMVTNYGNTSEPSDSALEKALRDQRSQMREWQKQADMLENEQLPKKSGYQQGNESSPELRQERRTTAEIMKDLIERHPELLNKDADKRLRALQQAWMRRVENEIEDLQHAIDNGERINRSHKTISFTEEMEDLRKQLEAKRREYAEIFPPIELSHEEKVKRIMKMLKKRRAKLEEKLDALRKAKTNEERAKILAHPKPVKVDDQRIRDIQAEIEQLKDDIEAEHDLHFLAGTPEELSNAIKRRIKTLANNLQRIEEKLAARDYSTMKKPPSALANAVSLDPEVIKATKLRNAARDRLAQERKQFKRSLTPYSAGGKVLDWWEALTSAPRIFRTMLDLSATFTQGAALTATHPILGYRALLNSIAAFQSEANTDNIQAAMNADPDWAEFIEMGGHAYTVSNLDERSIPEEFRGIEKKLITINGKEYGIGDIPGVKASERSFGMFLNSINLSLYKALKNAGGWGPTGPSISQKKDIANSLNVASGYGYDQTGQQGFWDNMVSIAMWAPRFAISGLKMATAYNVWRPQLMVAGSTADRSYADRATSSKQMAKEYVKQLTGMAAWTLLATLLLGRKDPEYLKEVIDPRSSEFLNVLIGNTRINFFGPIKQWWQFMARLLTGETVNGGKVRKTTAANTIIRMARSKASPIAGTIWNVIEGKDFTGEEYNGWKAVRDLTVPLSGNDLIEAWKENSVANALMLTPFIIAGAGKSTYHPDEYGMAVNPYLYDMSRYNDLRKQGDWKAANSLREENPLLKHSATMEMLIKRVKDAEKLRRSYEKDGREVPESVAKRETEAKMKVIEYIKRTAK